MPQKPPPLQSPERIRQLDALRGAAVIGIVWMNVYVFALPAQGYSNPAFSGALSSADKIIWLVSFVFIEDKFRTLFAVLFGAGCLILFEKGCAVNLTHAWRAHFARMGVLLIIGLVHGVFLASNDVLRAYAIAGCALPFLAHLSPRSLYVVAVGLVAVHLGGGIIAFGTALIEHSAGRINGDATLFAERNFGSHQGAVQASLERLREGLGSRVARRSEGIIEQLIAVTASLPINLAGIALGMALWKDRMLAAEWRVFRLQRLAAICAVLSLPAFLALAWLTIQSGFAGAVTGANALVFSAPFDVLLAITYAAIAMALFTKGGAITGVLAYAGRLSLTNYLMTSIILAAIFASWGLGLAGMVSRAEAFAISFVPIAAMLIGSPLWVRAFGTGPFERLWRGGVKLLC